MIAQGRDGIVKRSEATIGARQQDGALHGHEDKVSEHIRVGIGRQPPFSRFDEPSDGSAPGLEILDHKLSHLGMAVGHLQGEIADGTAQVETGGLKQPAIAVQHCKKPLDRPNRSPISRTKDNRLEEGLVFFQYGNQQILFRGKKIIKAATVYFRAL